MELHFREVTIEIFVGEWSGTLASRLPGQVACHLAASHQPSLRNVQLWTSSVSRTQRAQLKIRPDGDCGGSTDTRATTCLPDTETGRAWPPAAPPRGKRCRVRPGGGGGWRRVRDRFGPLRRMSYPGPTGRPRDRRVWPRMVTSGSRIPHPPRYHLCGAL